MGTSAPIMFTSCSTKQLVVAVLSSSSSISNSRSGSVHQLIEIYINYYVWGLKMHSTPWM